MAAKFDARRSAALAGMLSPERLTRVLDVGANPIEDNPYKGLLDAGLCEVWGFEPQPDAFKALTASKGTREHYLREAVGDGSDATLRVCRGDGYSSLLEPDQNTIRTLQRFGTFMTVVEEIPLKTTRLDDITDLPEFDLLKIDVQGSEVAVFEGGPEKLGKACVVISEVSAIPLYVNQPLLDGQMTSLGRLGYTLHKFMFLRSIKLGGPIFDRLPKRHYRSQISDGDAVFVRGLLDLPSLSDENLKHMAILADGVFESQDLAVFFLRALAERGVISTADMHRYIDGLPNVNPVKEPT